MKGNSDSNYSEKLRAFLATIGVWYRLIVFTESVETVKQAGQKVPVDQIAKSIIMIDSFGGPLVAIVPARSKVSHRKIKALLNVRDVRLASREEVFRYSGYPAGGVPPFSDIKRVFLDKQMLNNETIIAGGGDVDQLIEVKTSDIVRTLKPIIADISDQI